MTIPSTLLNCDFNDNSRFFFKEVPKYLDIQKTKQLLDSDKVNSILSVDPFPYLQGNYYINQNSYSFDKHSMIIGASGTGKSKLMSLFTDNTYKHYKDKYKIIMIDPHANLEKDVGGLESTKVIGFKNIQDSIDLFMKLDGDLVAGVELSVELLKSLMKDKYNNKLERMLRHSVYLLLINQSFDFVQLRKLLLESGFRNDLIKKYTTELPDSVVSFFLTDFNELRTKSYNEAIAPIIAFIDEMQLIPVFNKSEELPNIIDVASDNFLTLFSLNQTKLGLQATKVISGLIMQQIMQMLPVKPFDEHVILIIDEVSVVENPILKRLLSEARKYGCSVILAQQYFNQISNELRDAIFANVVNYFVFRISRGDAVLLEKQLSMQIVGHDNSEERIKMLTELNNRECIARLGKDDIILPAILAKTIDFKPIPKKEVKLIQSKNEPKPQPEIIERAKPDKEIKPFIPKNICLKEIMMSQSSSREELGELNE